MPSLDCAKCLRICAKFGLINKKKVALILCFFLHNLTKFLCFYGIFHACLRAKISIRKFLVRQRIHSQKLQGNYLYWIKFLTWDPSIVLYILHCTLFNIAHILNMVNVQTAVYSTGYCTVLYCKLLCIMVFTDLYCTVDSS